MGADQIGFLFKGPLRLSRCKDTRTRATERARVVRTALVNLAALDEPPEKLSDALVHLSREEVEEAVAGAASLPEPKVAVANLIGWWAHGARDTCARIDPDNPKQVMGFAGDRSWGDEPDGFGYCTYQAALILDILTPFGIR